MSQQPVKELFVTPDSTIGEVVACIDRSGKISIALVVDEHGRLINTLSDGDVRRGLLAGFDLDDCASALLEIKARTPHPVPVAAPVGTSETELLRMMQLQAVRQIPLLETDGVVSGIVSLAQLLPQATRELRAVVMAGGFGTRLRPLTDDTPKPMLPLGGRPLLEYVIEQLKSTGISRVVVATHYRPEKITSHFGDGSAFGVDIEYLREDVPLGTGGALGLLRRSDDPLLVINGDVLTGMDFRSMFAYHQENRADMTVGVRRYEMKVPYGVVDCDGERVRGLREKPEISFFVNAGVYLLEPTVLDLVQPHQHLNMTDLVTQLVDAGNSVVSYPICEYWIDIGQHDDYGRAQEDARNGRFASRFPGA